MSDSHSHFHFPHFGCGGGGGHGFEYRRNNIVIHRVFALRDLRADEEIVLGWEWGDGHAEPHLLPTLMESQGCLSASLVSQAGLMAH